MTRPAGHIDPAELRPDIAAYRAGEDGAGDRLCHRMRPAVRLATVRMLGDDDADVDDVIQDSLLACLGYLRDEGGFTGDPTRLAVTIALNRCRDILRRRQRHPLVAIEPLETWLADPAQSPLDQWTRDEQRHLLQGALDKLSAKCRDLLRALYLEDRTTEEVRRACGLGTVQAVYHRRGVCLAEVRKLLQRRLRFGSGGEASPRTDRGGH